MDTFVFVAFFPSTSRSITGAISNTCMDAMLKMNPDCIEQDVRSSLYRDVQQHFSIFLLVVSLFAQPLDISY